MEAPVEYIPQLIQPISEAVVVAELMDLDWVQRDNTPRMEYYWNANNKPYTYGAGAGVRTYEPQPLPGCVDYVNHLLTQYFLVYNGGQLSWPPAPFSVGSDDWKLFDVCFLNLYLTNRNHLGWHSDDSPEMDPEFPIATVSFGQPRPIRFRRKGETDYEELLLGSGSAAIMAPGMQQEWEHQLPKISDNQALPRASMTFRRYKEV